MIRWENKSPKDSEYWGPVTTKEEVERLFYTSLRCKSNPGKIFCFRPWIRLLDEYRCFWNGTLRAVSGDNENKNELNTKIIGQICSYISSISHRIPYIRCIFDIGQVEEEAKLVFKIIEFNSWETNSGAHLFDWREDSEILYDEPTAVHFRGQNYQETRPLLGLSPSYRPLATNINKPDTFEIIRGNYTILNNYVYMSNDIWLGKFTMTLEPVAWTRGVFRFSNIALVGGNNIRAGDFIYDAHFRKLKECNAVDEVLVYPRYGVLLRVGEVEMTAYLNDKCQFIFVS